MVRIGYGIDFGTTNSVVCSVTNDAPAYAYLDADGSPHPSVVWYHPEGVRVGREAKLNFNTWVETPGQRFIRSVKRDLGRRVTYDIRGEKIPAWRVASEIFRHLRDSAASGPAKGVIEESVVTVPVKFSGRGREDLRRAANLAGIEITTFVHEPFAAVVGYYRGMGQDLATLDDERVLVFDWGGGTLDVTLARVGNGRLEEEATAGLPDIAGDHFDQAIRGWSLARFRDRNQLSPELARPTRPAEDRLIWESERQKIALSSTTSVMLDVRRLLEVDGQPLDLEEELSRAEFERLISVDLARAVGLVDEVIAAARITAAEVDRVLLIGGSSNIPALQQEMHRRFGSRAIVAKRSQTIIAEGAAEVAFRGYQPYLVDPLGLRLADGTFMELIGRKADLPTPVPVERTLICTDPRDGVARLVVGERRSGGTERDVVYHAVLSAPVRSDLPKPFQHERVYATFDVDENLVFRARAHGAAAQEAVTLELYDLRFGLRVA